MISLGFSSSQEKEVQKRKHIQNTFTVHISTFIPFEYAEIISSYKICKCIMKINLGN